MPLFLAAAIPWLIGAGAVATGVSFYINDQNQKDAEKRANLAFEELQRQDDRFSKNKQGIQRDLTSEFGSANREELLQSQKDEIGAQLKATSERLRDDSALVDPVVGDASNQFINKRAGVQADLDLRLDEKTTNLANILAQGGANFQESDEVRARGQELTTESLLQQGSLRVHENKVNAASIVKDSLVADILGVVGPLALSAGIGAAFAPAAAGAGGALGSSGAGLSTGAFGVAQAGAPFFTTSIPTLASISGTSGLTAATGIGTALYTGARQGFAPKRGA